jgi:hypothetical protein
MRIAGSLAVACMSTSLLIGCVANMDGDESGDDGDVADEPVDVPADEPDPTPIAAGDPDLHPTYYNADEKEVFSLVNHLRGRSNLGALKASAILTQSAYADVQKMIASGTTTGSDAAKRYFSYAIEQDPMTDDQAGRVFGMVFQDEDSYEIFTLATAATTRTIGLAMGEANGKIFVAVRFGTDAGVAALSVGPGTIAQFGGFETQTTWPIAAPTAVTKAGAWYHKNNARIVSGASGYAGSAKVLRISDATTSFDTATQIVRARPGVYYRADVFVRAKAGNSGGQTISMTFLDAAMKPIVLNDDVTSVTISTGAATKWTEKATPDVKAPTGTTWVRIVLGDDSPAEQGSVDYDNVRLIAY